MDGHMEGREDDDDNDNDDDDADADEGDDAEDSSIVLMFIGAGRSNV